LGASLLRVSSGQLLRGRGKEIDRGAKGLIQAAKRRARGYRTTKNLINMAYLIAGKLDFRLPT